MTKKDIIRQLTAQLQRQIGNRRLAVELAGSIYSCCLDWSYPTARSVRGAKVAVAFSFGQRRLANGNREPGPNNEKLAELSVALFEATGCKLYAQWEIARVIGGDIPPGRLVPIYPPGPDPKLGTERYLSTVGVLTEVKRLAGPPCKLGKVLLLAFRDHMPRCVSLAREMGFDAYAPPRVELPTRYDPLDAQPWVRNRRAFFLHTMLSLFERHRSKVLGTGSSSGQLD